MNSPSRPRVVSLFSGIGATDLALQHLGCETVAHSDIEPYANQVFSLRFPESQQLGSVTDITEVPACEVMVGGFPCQDISNAGLREGIGGARSGLWSEFHRLIGLARPKVVLIENVSALLSRGIDVVLADLASIGYACEWDCIPAAAVGAPHLRDRIWITAYAEDEAPVRAQAELNAIPGGAFERSLATLTHPPSKWPRAGRMCMGAVYVREPLAPRKTKRLNPGSAWVGVRLDTRHGWWHERCMYPAPTARDAAASACSTAGRSGGTEHVHAGHTLTDAARLWAAGMWPIDARDAMVEVGTMRRRGLWPSPRTSDTNGPGRHGSGGADLRTAVDEASPGGYLNPRWVEWLMGYPLGWTDLSDPTPRFHGWNHEPADAPPSYRGGEGRRPRLHALGNGQVPQVAHWWIAPAIERLR